MRLILSIGQRIRRERMYLSWSQQLLAETVGTSTTSINRWENDKTLPHPYYRKQLCVIFGKPIEEIFSPADTGEQTEQRQHQVWNVPYLRNIYFTGREDILHALHNAFLATQTADATRFCALSGLGGIGKTQVAIEYVYRYGHEYNAILWATADTHQELVASFDTCAGLLGLLTKPELSTQTPIQEVLHWLHTNQHWLLIFDGVDNLEMISEFLPRRGEGHILLTTRSQATGSSIKGINVTPMGQAESFLLLLRRAKLISNVTELASISTSMRQDAEMICALFGGLPLALDQAATYIEENQCELRNYYALYQGQRKALLKRRGGANKRGYSRSVATTWTSSFQQIEQSNPIAADLLRLLAFLPPGTISQEVLVAGIVGLDEVLQPIAQNSLILDDAIGELLRYSLVGRYLETKMLTIHPLVQQVIKDRLDEMAQRQWAMRATQIVNHVLSANLILLGGQRK
ncbi:MAG: helix-turn-helix domain-containing protein [Ktedonobacteraceae bacterium]|nr:helix-turn-helix domain-containing protein [Ktedonobacteraceae bacterium]